MEFNATFIITTISFILFTFIMNKIFYAPLGKIIDERQNTLTEHIMMQKILKIRPHLY